MLPLAGAAAQNCDPSRAQIHQAQALIANRDMDGATQLLTSILNADPVNVMGNYLLGTIKIATPGQANQDEGLRKIEYAVAQIAKRPAACAQQLGWYSLYITLGAQYYARNDITRAKQTFLIAYAHQASLDMASKKLLFDDLGRISLAQGDLKGAQGYYDQGAKLGNQNSATAVQAVKQLRGIR